MSRQKQRCPYCGKRMSYFSAYSCRRKAEYVCPRCGKECRVAISKLMGMWFFFQMLSNPWGIALVAAPLVLFLLFSPQFVRLEPLKKYQKSMEARKAGIEYSDNLTALDFEDSASSSEGGMKFEINADLFNQIKSSRSTSKEQADGKEIVSNSEAVSQEGGTKVIKTRYMKDK